MALKIVHLMRRARRNEVSIERVYEDVRQAMDDRCEVDVWTCPFYSSGFWSRLANMWQARRLRGDVLHVTGDVHYLTFLLNRKRTVLTVHDLTKLDRLKGMRRRIFWFLWYWLPVLCSRKVITISECTRRHLLDAVKCDPAKVDVIHNSVSAEFRPYKYWFNTSYPRILQIGTGWNKNVERVAEALAGIPCKLAIIGELSEEQVSILRRHGIDFESQSGLSRVGLLSQYVVADLVVFASVYEGFGLPIVEAQAVGRPVVTSNIYSMPEVAGEGARLVDPLDVRDIRQGILDIIRDESYRDRLVEQGFRNVERFKPATIADRYIALYQEVAG